MKDNNIYIYIGFKFGFLLHYAGLGINCEAQNLKSARKAPHVFPLRVIKRSHYG